MGVPADLGAKINRRKRAIRIDPDIMKDVSTEWGNERDQVSLKVGDAGDKMKEISFNKLFLGDPEFLSLVVDDGVLMWVAIDDEGASRSGEEVREEINYKRLLL